MVAGVLDCFMFFSFFSETKKQKSSTPPPPLCSTSLARSWFPSLKASWFLPLPVCQWAPSPAGNRSWVHLLETLNKVWWAESKRKPRVRWKQTFVWYLCVPWSEPCEVGGSLFHILNTESRFYSDVSFRISGCVWLSVIWYCCHKHLWHVQHSAERWSLAWRPLILLLVEEKEKSAQMIHTVLYF